MENRNETLFKTIPIFNADLTDEEIKSFSVKHKDGKGLIKYLYGIAESEEESNVMRTYIVRDNYTDEFVGYFSLKAGMISINEQIIVDKKYFDTLPGIEIANFAINSTYIDKHKDLKGCGRVIFDLFITPIIEDVSKKIGVKLIYIFSLPIDSLMKRYQEYGFKRLTSKQEEELHKRLKPIYDEGCIFMYQEL